MRNAIFMSLGSFLLALFLTSCVGKVRVQPQPQPDAVSRLTREQATKDLIAGAMGSYNCWAQDAGDFKTTDVKVGRSGFRVICGHGRIHDFIFAQLPSSPTNGNDGLVDRFGAMESGLCWMTNDTAAVKAEQLFVNALEYFKQPHPIQALDDSAFDKNLAKYKAMKDKELPEKAHMYQVQAFGAVDDKNFDHAAECFQNALNLAPWWSQGWFNLALTQAQLADYPGAIEAMNKYLKLEPDAPDARDAKDKIYQWQDK